MDKQNYPGFADEVGAWHFILSPKEGKTWSYTIKSTLPALDGQMGGFTTYWLTPDLASQPSARYPNWWTDNPDPVLAEGNFAGAKTVSQWREEFLSDFAKRMNRAARPAPSAPTQSGIR